jgi:sigma-B regulation protein RsbU (phosphoserine phosphatase)
MSTTAPPVELQAIEKLREEELEEARSIQSVMLPAEPLRVGKVKISHSFQPIAEVGGDFLDYFELTDGSVGLYVGDVSGKGLPAAMYAALAVGTLRGVHKTGMSPGDVLSTLNRRLMIRGMPRRHAAVQYAVFDPGSREMRIAGAGMPCPFHISLEGCRSLEISGIPPGLFSPTVAYDTSKMTIEAGDSVLFCTDGITDAFNTEGESFGIERLQTICETGVCRSPTDLLGRIFAAVERFTRGKAQHDDMAAAVFHYSPD